MEKVAQYERVFKQFDGNGDGKISPMELQQCAGAIGGELSLTEAVGLDDFVKFVDGGCDEEKVCVLREAFKMYVMDGSGCITPKSLKRMLSRLGESKSVDECKNMIASFDLNGDGVLNFDEFKVMMF